MKWLKENAVGRFILATVFSQSLFFHAPQANTFGLALSGLMLAALTLTLFILLHKPYAYLVSNNRHKSWHRLAYVAFFALLGIALTFAFAFKPAPLQKHSLTITATGERDPRALSSEVWTHVEIDGRQLRAGELANDGRWVQRQNEMLSAPPQQAAVLRWHGTVKNSARVVFVAHQWSGEATIEWDGKVQVLDLFTAGNDNARHVDLLPQNVPENYPFLEFPERTLLQQWVQCCDGLLTGFLFLLLAEWLARRRLGTFPTSISLRLGPLWFALPMMVSSAVLLLIFYPGIMSSDSMDQWNQASTGRYSNWHPVYHTLLIVALRYIWDSPACIALFQAGTLALACGWLIHTIQKALRAPLWSAWLASLLCALCPMITVTSITLWKDVPYGTALVGLTAMAISLTYLEPPSIRKPWVFLAMLGLAVMAMLLRHNGPPAALVTIVVLMFLVKPARRQLAALGLSSIVVYLLLAGPLSTALGTVKIQAKFALAAHHIAAHLSAGEQPDNPRYLSLIQDIDSSDPHWHYNCASVDATIFNQKFSAGLAEKHTDDMMAMWLELAAHHPLTELRHVLCVSSLVWSINGAPSSSGRLYVSTSPIYSDYGTIVWMAVDKRGPVAAPASPQLAQRLGTIIDSSEHSMWWRPAIYLLMLIFGVVVGLRRTGSARIVFAALTTIAVHSAVLCLVNVAQDARYQYPVYMLCIAMLPCLLTARRNVSGEVVVQSLPRNFGTER
jgi:hypothetical protein